MASSVDIANRLDAIEARIGAACEKAGRDRSDVTLIGASKVHGVDRLRAAFDAGLRVFGENLVQEGLAKAAELPPEIDWHLIGPLQSNKVRKAVEMFSTIHSIDRLKIARAIDRVAVERGVRRRGLLEVNLGLESTKHGFAPAVVADALGELRDLEALDLIGLMAIPPFGDSPEDSRPWFAELRELEAAVAARASRCWLGCLSMGMSHDFEIAIAEGATHVRIGTDLFGPRPQREH